MAKRNNPIIFLYYLLYSFIYAGWLSHRSVVPDIFIYSKGYFVFLCVMALPFFLPLMARVYIKTIGVKGFWYSVILAIAAFLILYVPSAIYYYYTEEHLFDPFLQNPPSKINITDKDPGTFRILCLGGSTTEELALPEDKRYPAVLEDILRKRYPAAKIEVFNGAKNWYTTKHSLISYITYYSDWKPDLIIVMHAINDLCRSFSPRDFAIGPYNSLWAHFYGPAINGARPPTFEEHLLGYFEVPLNAWYARYRFLEADYPLDTYVSFSAFKENLRKIVRYGRANSADIILVSQPSLYKEKMGIEEKQALYFGRTIANRRLNFMQTEYPSAESFCRAMKIFNEAARSVALSEGALFVDADGAIEKNLDNFEDDAHYTQRGARLLAEAIAEKIKLP